MRHSTTGLLPDFGSRRAGMTQWIIGVGKLIKYDTLASICHLCREIACPFHAFFLADLDQFSTISFHGPLTLGAHVVGHNKFHFIAPNSSRHRQCNTRITAGSFNDRVAGLNPTVCLSLSDHAHCRPVLDRSSRVITFKFCQHNTIWILQHSLQAHERRFTDG